MMSEDPLKLAIRLILRYVSIRDRSKREVAEYLERKSITEDIIQNAIQYATENEFLDDIKFAQEWIHMRLRQGKGDMVIKQELLQKGIPREDIGGLLENIPLEVWIEAMGNLATRKHLPSKITTIQEKLSLKKALYQRGFSSHYIDAFLQYKVQ